MTYLDEDVEDLLRHLDHPRPSVQASDVMRRADSRRWTALGRAAAVILVLGVGGVAWAAPGSPLPRFVSRVASWMKGAPAVPPARVVASPPAVPAPPRASFAGVAVAPGRRLLVSFRAAQVAGAAHISILDVPDVSVRTVVGGAAFTSSDGELLVDNRGSTASFDIVIPREAAFVEIQVEGRRVFRKDGGRVMPTTLVPQGTQYTVPLAHSAATPP